MINNNQNVDEILQICKKVSPQKKTHICTLLSKILNLKSIEILTNPNPAIHQPAAESWASYETSCSTLRAGFRHMSGPRALCLARIEAHYFVNNCFMPENHIMNNIERIKHLPAHIIQGRHDVICPPFTATKLANEWGRNGKLIIVDDAGHSTFEQGIAYAILAALEEL